MRSIALKTSRSAAGAIHGTGPPAERATGPVQAWVRFWFAAVDPVGLHCLRLLAGLLFMFWLLAFAGHQGALFGLDGWFDETAYGEAARIPAAREPGLD